jgi:ribose 5-phosphate isomerase B
MGGRVVSFELAEQIVEKFLGTPFEGGRHERRVELLSAIEKEERA